MTTTLVLASASPRRRDLLERFGVAFDVRPTHVDETPQPGEAAEDLVRRLAATKAEAALAAAPEAELVILAADTVVVIDGDVLGKPVDAAEAEAMVRRLSGRTHRVLTGVAVAARSGGAAEAGVGVTLGPAVSVAVAVAATDVVVAELSEADVAWYLATGESHDKAGGYGIQGRFAVFVTEIRGSHDNVVGLPLARTRTLLAQAGLGLGTLPGRGRDDV